MEPRGDDESSLPFRGAPALAYLAVASAVFDLVVSRGFLRYQAAVDPTNMPSVANGLANLTRNLAATAALVALSIALFDFFREPRFASVTRRLFIATFAGIFLLTALFAIVLPPEIFVPAGQSLLIVRLGNGAAQVISILLGMTVVFKAHRPLVRAGIALLTSAAFCALSTQALRGVIELMLDRGMTWQSAFLMQQAFRKTGEVCYLLGPIVLAAGIATPRLARRTILQVAVFVFVSTSFGLLLHTASGTLGERFAVLIYGAQRLELFAAGRPSIYVVVLSIVSGVVAAGFLSPKAAERQTVAGMAALLAAGYAPAATGTNLFMALGMALLVRGTYVLAERTRERESSAQGIDRSRAVDSPDASA